MRYFFLAFSSLLVFCQHIVTGQSVALNREGYRLEAVRTVHPIEVDGILDEAVWKNTGKTSPFHRITPIDTGYARCTNRSDDGLR